MSPDELLAEAQERHRAASAIKERRDAAADPDIRRLLDAALLVASNDATEAYQRYLLSLPVEGNA